jgi:hypothetical protein
MLKQAAAVIINQQDCGNEITRDANWSVGLGDTINDSAHACKCYFVLQPLGQLQTL